MELDFEEKSAGFLVTLSYTEQKTSTAIKEGEKEGERLSVTQQEILRMMVINPKITISELSSIIGINGTNIERNIKKLRNLGKIERVGPAKGGYWKVLVN